MQMDGARMATVEADRSCPAIVLEEEDVKECCASRSMKQNTTNSKAEVRMRAFRMYQDI